MARIRLTLLRHSGRDRQAATVASSSTETQPPPVGCVYQLSDDARGSLSLTSHGWTVLLLLYNNTLVSHMSCHHLVARFLHCHQNQGSLIAIQRRHSSRHDMSSIATRSRDGIAMLLMFASKSASWQLPRFE